MLAKELLLSTRPASFLHGLPAFADLWLGGFSLRLYVCTDRTLDEPTLASETERRILRAMDKTDVAFLFKALSLSTGEKAGRVTAMYST